MVMGQNAFSQTNPGITSWLINSSGQTGKHYVQGNSIPQNDTAQVNVQQVRYSANYSYINCSGFPSYIVGPYLDGNPSLATNNNWLFKIPLNPTQNTGTLTSTPLGAIEIFINGVPMYDYKDAFSYSLTNGSDQEQGGDGVWNRNAIFAEKASFDCSKGHPSPVFQGPPGPGGTLVGGSYHHHQNPTAFNLDLVEISTICDLYLADGLYTIDSTQHSPLIGFAFDGYPVDGPYSYANTNRTGGIKRMESSYQLRNISVRTYFGDGTDVTDGPAVSSSYPLGWYREDYEFIQGSGDLDIHNGRFCVTPEYPQGTYAYFATVDANWNSAYPYLLGASYYGVVETSNFTFGGQTSVVVNEPVTNYSQPTSTEETQKEPKAFIYPNPCSDFVSVQVGPMNETDILIELFDMTGRKVGTASINKGSTITYMDTRMLYSGDYLLRITNGSKTSVQKLVISH